MVQLWQCEAVGIWLSLTAGQPLFFLPDFACDWGRQNRDVPW